MLFLNYFSATPLVGYTCHDLRLNGLPLRRANLPISDCYGSFPALEVVTTKAFVARGQLLEAGTEITGRGSVLVTRTHTGAKYLSPKLVDITSRDDPGSARVSP